MHSVERLLTNKPDPKYLDRSFRDTYERHLKYISDNGLFDIVTIPKNVTNMYVGDFYGALLHININPDVLWFSLRLSGYHNSSDYDGKVEIALIPRRNFLEKILGKKLNVLKLS